MRVIIKLVLVFSLVVSAFCTTAEAQTKRNKKSTKPAAQKQKEYLKIFNPVTVGDHYKEYRNKDVQIPDYFGKNLSARQYETLVDRNDRRTLSRSGVSITNQFIFTTDTFLGSSMLCYAPRDNESVKAFFEQPIVSKKPIYVMGRIGKQMLTEEGIMTLFAVDKIAIGHTPQVKDAKVEKKTVTFIMEYDVQTPTGTVRRKMPKPFLVPEPGKTYAYPNPYDPSKKIYLRFQY